MRAAEVDSNQWHASVAEFFAALVKFRGIRATHADANKWEIATALACSLLEVNPFHEPNVLERRTRISRLLERPSAGKQPTVRVREAELELFAEGETRRELSTLSMSEALRTFFALRQSEGFLAVVPFMDLNPNRTASIGRICEQLESRLRIPVFVTDGPRHLYTVGQLYTDGPPKGLVIVLTANPAKDLIVPGAEYSLGQIQAAMAQVEFESLSRLGRHVIRLHLTSGADAGLVRLEMIVGHLPSF